MCQELKKLVTNEISETRKKYNSTLKLYKEIDAKAWSRKEYDDWWFHLGKNYIKTGRMNASADERSVGVSYHYEKIKISKDLKSLKKKMKDLNRLIDSKYKVEHLFFADLESYGITHEEIKSALN
jgi:hypothetical protein